MRELAARACCRRRPGRILASWASWSPTSGHGEEEIVLMQTTTDGLRRLLPLLPLAEAIAQLGYGLTERLPVAKNLLVRYALGAI